MIIQHLKTLQKLIEQTLKADGDLPSRISTAALKATIAEQTTRDFFAFRNAVKDMPMECKTTLKELVDLDDSALASLLYEFSIVDRKCREIENLLAGISGGYDRYLNLVRSSTGRSHEKVKIIIRAASQSQYTSYG